MMPVTVALSSVLALLGVPLLAATSRRSSVATHLVYGASLAICLVALAVALSTLVNGANATSSLRLALGLPWIGAHFRMDALAAFFLAVANLGGAAASLFAIGYGQHEKAPGRVLPFYAAFLAGMNLVILADDAFTFLVSWEFMSLSSWALVMAHHRDPDNRRAGYIYIIMASFGTLCLLLAFGLLAGGAGGYTFAEIRGSAAALPGLVLILALMGAGS
jgi:formate hydrogenlyase subunit 3/multisubunit Na+/H+ antiporter MnhD subunit